MRINNKGDIIPIKINDNVNYKNSYHWNFTDSNIHVTFASGGARWNYFCGLLCIGVDVNTNYAQPAHGFAKVTILDN